MSAQPKTITGGCLCGAVQYEVEGTPNDVGYCHCRMCQRASGGLFGYFVMFSKRTFRLTQGEPKFYKSSAWAERGFCANCGTPLFMRDTSEDIGIMGGSLDHLEEFPPIDHSGIESQVPWLKIDDDLPRWKTEDDPYFVAAMQAEADDEAGG